MDITKLWPLIGDGRLWAVCGVAFGLGALGGFIQAVSSMQSWADLKRDWWRRILIGAVAAVAVIYVSEPETPLAFIGGSLVAGYAGQAILGALEARAKLAVATAQVVDTKQELKVKTEEVNRATRTLESVDRLLETVDADAKGEAVRPPARLPIEDARALVRAALRPTAGGRS